MQLLETQRLKLLPFTLELKRATLAERARLTEMLGVAIPDAWPGADLLEALPLFIEAMEQEKPTQHSLDIGDSYPLDEKACTPEQRCIL